MAVNLNKEYYRSQTAENVPIREITPIHLLSEEETITESSREIVPTVEVEAVREHTPVHIRKEETSLEKANKAIEKAVEKEEKRNNIKAIALVVVSVVLFVLLLVGVFYFPDSFVKEVSSASSDVFSLMDDMLNFMAGSFLPLFVGISCLFFGIRAIGKLMNLR